MLPLSSIGEQIATKRKALGLTQPALAKKARVGLSTLDALENGRLGELGYSKVTNILSALRLELKLQEASTRRPTLDELMEEESDDKGLDRRRCRGAPRQARNARQPLRPSARHYARARRPRDHAGAPPLLGRAVRTSPHIRDESARRRAPRKAAA